MILSLHAMSEEVVTKRLHVSGLTPAIRPEDLSQKLASFGTVKALDVFGTVDGLGQPRKFGYVTIETSKAKLARCQYVVILAYESAHPFACHIVRHEPSQWCNVEGCKTAYWRGKT